jgi:predicted dehydrogenase
MEFQGELHFANGVSATFFNSFRANHQQWAHISGTKGYLQVNDFVLPYYGNEVSFDVGNHNFAADKCFFNMEKSLRTHSLCEYSNNAKNAQETSLFRTFSGLVLSGQRDSFWPEVALKTQRILDAALKSANSDGAAVTPNTAP